MWPYVSRARVLLQIRYQGKQQSQQGPDMVETVIQLAAEKIEPKEVTHTTIDNLMPRTVYSFNVSAYFLDSKAEVRPRRIDVETLSDGITLQYNTLQTI